MSRRAMSRRKTEASINHLGCFADEVVDVSGCEDEVTAVELYLVWRDASTSVPADLDDGSNFPGRFAGVALDAGANTEAEVLEALVAGILRIDARHETLFELLVIQVLANEGQLVDTRLVRIPRLGEVAIEDHVHCLVDKLGVVASDGEHALHAEDVRPLVLQQVTHPRLDQVEVEAAWCIDPEARHTRVMLVAAVGVEKLRVHLERAREVKPFDVEDTIDGHLRVGAALDRRELVDVTQSLRDALELLLVGNKVALVQQQPVRKRDLLDRLVLSTLRLLFVQVLLNVLRVNHGDDTVEPRKRLDLIVNKKSLRDWGRVGHASGFDHDRIELELSRAHALRQLLQNGDEILPHRAADATVHHLEDLLLGLHLGVLGEQRVVDADLAELVLDHRDLLPVRRREDVVEQRRLPAAEEPSEHGHRHEVDLTHGEVWLASRLK
mmetsp:Transcript_19262/g.44278  ORF Transcript_19262/g.44278 Transcript_19262/m.44278 type:complete len:439 (-) Transcript_19262:38-1354(-)